MNDNQQHLFIIFGPTVSTLPGKQDSFSKKHMWVIDSWINTSFQAGDLSLVRLDTSYEQSNTHIRLKTYLIIMVHAWTITVHRSIYVHEMK